jgi:uncharacterized membrane protein YtjA (UPF0391 family)
MTILKWAVIMLLVSLVAALFGFTDLAAASAEVARVLFYIFAVIFLVLLVLGLTVYRKVSGPLAWTERGESIMSVGAIILIILIIALLGGFSGIGGGPFYGTGYYGGGGLGLVIVILLILLLLGRI